MNQLKGKGEPLAVEAEGLLFRIYELLSSTKGKFSTNVGDTYINSKYTQEDIR